MAVALEHEFAALPHADARPGVHMFSRAWVLALVAADVVLFLAATYLASLFVKSFWLPTLPIRHVVAPATLTAVLSVVVFWQLGLYRRSFAMSVRDEFYHAVAALSLASAPVLIVYSLFPWISTSRLVAIFGLLFAIALVGTTRAVFHRLRDVFMLAHPRRIAVVGHPSRLEFAEDAMRSLPNARVFRLSVPNIDAVGALSPDAVASQVWFRHAVEWGCETLVFTEILPPSMMPQVLAAAQQAGMTIAFAPPRIRVHAYDLHMETIGKQALIVASPLKATRPGPRLGKRLFDITIGAIALVLFAPVMLLVAAAISFEDGEPVLYRQERVGRDGKTFNILKFRSMGMDAEKDGAALATVGDARVTRVGKFIRRTSLDELPQLINVLRGEMSIVGPRPERPVFVDMFEQKYPRYAERHLVPPGITGWSQVYGKRVVGFEDVPEKLSGDLFYVENWSLFMDVAVCLKTVTEVLFHKAA
ncbi:MAG TPA: sugar transferase [Candidatus Elarobacter sp.]|jgi:exopolysaccharide biosynthesis polyprenyl glycosylphosphotransferase|nr:sugar transferase [Candidatus Elarobacter sp.]